MAKISGKNRAPEDKRLPAAIQDMEFWRELSRQIVPQIQDEFELGELATMLQQQSQLIGLHWQKLSKIIGNAPDKCGGIAFTFDVDRTQTPSEVSVKDSFSEKFGKRLKATVPDPSQNELPLGKPDAEKPPKE